MNRLTIISVAVSDYNHLKKLNGPTSDIQKLKFLLVENPETAVCNAENYIEIINP